MRRRSVLFRRAWRVAKAFARDRRAGAMLYTGVAALTLLTSVGAMMTNYAWREAQLEEIDSALRASVAAAGQLLDRLSDPASRTSTEALIRDRVAKFLDGLLAQVDVDDDDVTVSHDASSRVTRVTVGGQAQVAFDKLFGDAEDERGNVSLPTRTVAVQLLTDRYEVAIAVDLTFSMERRMADADGNAGQGPKRVDALKSAVEVIGTVMRERNTRDAGSLAVAVVPFGPAVNVADTSGRGDTLGKRRYARMLIGADIDTDDARASTHHWVDAFHDYGTGANMGELQSRTLPDFYLGSKDSGGNARSDWVTTANWDLRAAGNVDISSQAPMIGDDGKWAVNGADFWNGCVMARWGAYWNTDARPSTWVGDDPVASSWPAQAAVAAWTPGGTALTSQPLHLSDAPPAYASPNTRFTAYSWPDSSIAANADGHLHGVLVEMLDDAGRSASASTTHTINADRRTAIGTMAGYNDWTKRSQAYGNDGSSQCPTQAILPLTDNATTVEDAFREFTVIPRHGGRVSQTFLHLGVVWGLRSVSPLWAKVWNTTDASGVERPFAACASGETGTHCDPNLKKVIVLITDGFNFVPRPQGGRIARKTGSTPNPSTLAGWETYTSSSSCLTFNSYSSDYGTAMGDTDASTFNARFGTFVDSSGAFTADGIDHLVNAFDLVMHDGTASDADVQGMKTALTGISQLTPWQLFRGHGFLDSGNSSHVIDRLVAANTHFGFLGRPMHNDHICRRGMVFTPYGAPDDLVQIGARPVEGVAPFTRGADTADTPAAIQQEQNDVMDGWLEDACSLAGDRGVDIQVVFVANAPDASTRFNMLETCIDEAGGEAGQNEVIATPTQAELQQALENIFRVERKLRFLET